MLMEWCGIMYYSCRDVTLSGYRKVCSATAAGIKKAAFEDEAWSCPHDGFRQCGSSSGPFWRAHRYYTSLITTRTCAWMLPGARDAPLVLHMAVIFLSLEAVQATSFYLRYRKAMRQTEEAFAEAEAAAEAEEEAEEADDNNNNNDNDDESVHGEHTARGTSEASGQRQSWVRLPRGSSRSLHRLCSYWALIERAVRRAPQKHAGVPTTAAELGRFFSAEENTSGDAQRNGKDERPPASRTSDGAHPHSTSDGVPHGAEKVLVLSDEHTFPVMHCSYDCLDSATSTTNATMVSSMDAVSPLETIGHGCRGGTGAIASPPPQPPPFASPNTSLRHPSPAVVVDEIAQPWQVLHALWTDTVRYSVNYTEIRQLLLGCNAAELAKLYEENGDAGSGMGSRTGRDHVFRHLWRSIGHPSRQASNEALSNGSETHVDSPLHNTAAASFSAHCVASPSSQTSASPRFTDGRVSTVCMALTWYLAVIREVYEAVVVYQDVQRCAEALEELEEYQRAVYQRGIEVGGDFFDAALRTAQAHAEQSSSESTHHETAWAARSGGGVGGGGAALNRQLQLPQVASVVDTAHEGATVNAAACCSRNASPPPPLFPRGDAVPRQGPSKANPLAIDFSPSSTPPLSPQEERARCMIALRGASPRACWAELTAALAALLRRRRLMELACVRSLFCYMYTGSATKIFSFAILAMLTSLSSRVAALGQASREAISANLDTYYRASAQADRCCNGGGSGGGGGGDASTPVGARIFALFGFECVRLAVNTVLARTTHEYITLAASQRRNTVKAELYEALTRMPLAFFDLHSYDEIEQIVYYVNDIEGVEVHVHNYVSGLVMSLFAVQHAMRQLPFRARLLVGVTVAASFGVKYAGKRVTTWTQTAQKTGGVLPPWLRGYGLDGTVSATAELDAQVEENMESNARQGGVMLRGLDIVAVLPQLRPYAADLSLMRWWTDHTRMMGAASGATEATTLIGSLLVVPQQLYGKMLPALGGALTTFADWVLPTVVSSYGASMAFSGVDALSLSNRLIEAMRCVGDMVDAVADAQRVAEVVLLNAYKANVLERVLDQRLWEPATMDYMKEFPFNLPEEAPATPATSPLTATTAVAATAAVGGGGGGGRSESKENTEAPSSALIASESPDLLSASQRRSSAWYEPSGSPGAGHHPSLGKSFRRPPPAPPSFAARCSRNITVVAAWLLAHSPPMLAFNGALFMLRKGLCWAGFAAPAPCGPSGIAGGALDGKARLALLHHRFTRSKRHHQRHHVHLRHDDKRRHRSTPAAAPLQRPHASLADGVSAHGNSTNVGSFLRVDRHGSGGGGSVSDGNQTEAYYSDMPPEGGRLEASSAFPSTSGSFADSANFDSSSTSSSSDEVAMAEGRGAKRDTEAAAAAAAAALVSATVHAVSVQNLQFYYPTAPTVPVFPKPITCTFALQSEEWLETPNAQSPSTPATTRRNMRGRLVCLVGPSGHGKSTLLSLLLGMYTHYSTPEEQGCARPFPSPSPSPQWGAAADTPAPSDGDEVETVSFGSPRLADPSAASHLPADILLSLRLPTATPRGSSDGGRSSSGVFDAGSSSSYYEEQLPVSVIPRDILRGNLFSFVPQSPVIFSGATIAHNISLENFISLEQEDLLAEIAQCAEWARCEYIQRFPQGLMTYIADSGTGAWSSPLASAAAGGAGGGGGMVRLSGGQAQRLMMARALFHGRRGGTVLVMDEPTASLDHEVKMEILGEWRGLLDEGIVRGMICATHDADLIEVADEVVRLP